MRLTGEIRTIDLGLGGVNGRCIEIINVRGAPTVPSHGRWHEIHLRAFHIN